MNREERRRKLKQRGISPRISDWETLRRRQFEEDHTIREYDCPACWMRYGRRYEMGVVPDGYERRMLHREVECFVCHSVTSRQTFHHVPSGTGELDAEQVMALPWLGEESTLSIHPVQP